jgi:aminoglycoside 2''-phosphotransferase
MFTAETVWKDRVHKLVPDLKIEQLEINQEGLINDIVIVNRGIVFRFAKSEESARILELEMRTLDLIRPRVSLEVPTPFYEDAGVVAYPFIPGQPLLLENVLDLDSESRQSLAAHIGKFLYELHTVQPSDSMSPLPATRAYVKREDWLEFQKRFQAKAYPLLQQHQVHWIERLFDQALENPEFFNYAPALIHGDFAPYHILYSPQENRVSGVIDFGMAGVGDPAADFGILISIYGEHFILEMQRAYPGLESCMSRARFYAQSIELEWVLRGLESGETFWFGAHLGGARDIRQQ